MENVFITGQVSAADGCFGGECPVSLVVEIKKSAAPTMLVGAALLLLARIYRPRVFCRSEEY